VLLVADGRGQILDRLAQAWRDHWTGRPHDVVYSAEHHAWALRRAGDRASLVHWIDPLAFSFAPEATHVPQVVMAHHLTPPDVEPMRGALRGADAITTSSRRWQKKLGELTGRDVWLVPYTLDTSHFVRRADAAAIRRGYGISDSEFVIGFSARANANAFGRKGIDLLLQTVTEARQVWSDLALMLIGSGWETLSREVEQTGVRAIHLVPETTEHTSVMYPAMDVFFCTSREEGDRARFSRRWRAACRSSRPTSDMCPRSSPTASPASSPGSSRRKSTSTPCASCVRMRSCTRA
jgi:hypothetical protein